MWLDNLRDLRKKTGLSYKQIGEKENLPERTVARIFSGDTTDPRIDTLRKIAHALGGSMDEILAESDFRLPTPQVEALKKEISSLSAVVAEMSANESMLKAEIAVLKDKIVKLTTENDTLRLKLEYEEKIVALHNYYIKRSSENHEQ